MRVRTRRSYCGRSTALARSEWLLWRWGRREVGLEQGADDGVFFPPCSYGIIRLPKGTPTSIAYASNTTLVVGCTDHTVFLYNLKTGEVIRRFRGHRGIVNSVDVQHGGAGKGLIVTGSDDGTVRVWSDEAKEEVEVVELGYPITSVRPFPLLSLGLGAQLT